MLPEIPGTVAFAGRASGGIFYGSDHGARLQAITVFVLDGVLLIIENRVKALVQVRNMVATVEEVVDEDFPVAMNVVDSAIEVMQFADAERCNAPDQTSEKLCQRGRTIVEVNEDEAFPGFHSNRNQAVLCAVEIFDAFKLRHAFERSIKAVVPPVIGAMQERGVTTGLSYNRSGVVAANIVEGTQISVVAPNHDDRLTRHGGGNELPRILHLIGARDKLPRLAEYFKPLEFGKSRIHVPPRRNG